ncbi:MAG: hypothetical protein CMN94_05110 [Synechococcus sp. EAC657]|nr:hypothetical protein [Synechococcus sp. EAC657]
MFVFGFQVASSPVVIDGGALNKLMTAVNEPLIVPSASAASSSVGDSGSGAKVDVSACGDAFFSTAHPVITSRALPKTINVARVIRDFRVLELLFWH